MSDNALNVLTLATELESQLIQSLSVTASGSQLVLAPQLLSRFFEVLKEATRYAQQEGFQRVALLCDPRIRRELRLLVERAYPQMPVLSYAEIAPGFFVQNVRTLNLESSILPE